MKSILRIIPFLKPYWKIAAATLTLLVAVVVMDLTIPRLIQRIIDQGISAGDLQVVQSTSLLMLAITILSLVFASGMSVLSVFVGESFSRDFRQAIFTKIQSFSFGNLDELQTGPLITRLTSDVQLSQRLVQISLRIGTRAPLLLIGSLFLLVQTSPRLALFLLPLFIITGLLIGFFISRLGPYFMTVQEKLDRLNNRLQENIAGVRVVKAFVRAEHEKERFDLANQDYMDWNIKVMEFMAFLMPTLMACINVGIVIVIWFGGSQAIDGQLTAGEIVAFTNYLMTIMMPLMIMAMISTVVAAASASIERIFEVLDSQAKVQDSPNPVELPPNSPGQVTFEDVCFSYDGRCDEPVLQGIDLFAEAGETVAILGATGAGKSTLVNLIPRFYDVSQGRICIDGQDIQELSRDSLLAQIGIVLQDSILFSGSVRENIRYGRPNAGEEEVIAAAKAAQAHDFICALPQGYDTQVAGRGVNLSGGQKQRIAIARALLLRPKILIMDDSTSAVDVETEAKIQAAMESLSDHTAKFIVAQRISTVLDADKILVLDRGQIVAQGTHQELLQSSKIYQEIYDSQLGAGNGAAADE